MTTRKLDLFSTLIRKYPPWPEVLAFQSKMLESTLINDSSPGDDDRTARIEELEFHEKQGLVFYGEKKWLESREYLTTVTSYDDWVLKMVCDWLKTPDSLVAYHDYSGMERIGTDEKALPPIFDPEVDHWCSYSGIMKFMILPNDKPATPAEYVKIFHLFFNAPYYIQKVCDNTIVKDDLVENFSERGELPLGVEGHRPLKFVGIYFHRDDVVQRCWYLMIERDGIENWQPFFEHEHAIDLPKDWDCFVPPNVSVNEYEYKYSDYRDHLLKEQGLSKPTRPFWR